VLIVLVFGAVRAVLRHKMRSGLTSLGLTIGVAAVVWVVAIGRAGSARAEAQLHDLGDNLVWVEAGSRAVNGMRTGPRGTDTLTVGDMEAIRAGVPLIKSVSPNIDGTVFVIHGSHNWTTRYRGVSGDYLDIKRWQIAEGARFTEDEENRAANVVLIGATVKAQLFGEEHAVGETIRVGLQPYEVVGVLAAKGQSGSGQDQDDTVMFPFRTALRKLHPKSVTWLDDILCSAESPEAVEPAVAQIQEILRQRHHIGPGEDDDFNIRRPEEVIKAQLQTSQTFSLLLTCIASVALLVGGVGVMNVMLASVAERTREVGVRLAVGATPFAVQLQFLIEAVVLCLFGGMAGVALSIVGEYVLQRILKWPLSVAPEALVLAVSFSAAVGVVFGFYPAWRASQLDPIEALRRD
jgi:putative ABC transport system permease protein